MGVPARHILRQGPVLGALARTAFLSLDPRPRRKSASAPPELPGPEVAGDVKPLPAALIADFVREAGGDPRNYRNTVPPHLFPQWAFPLAGRCFEKLPYPMTRVMNGGCSMQLQSSLPAGTPLRARANLVSVDDDGTRALLTARVVTGTEAQPDALIAEFHAFVPLAAKSDGPSPTGPSKDKPKDKPRVPVDAREIGRHRLARNAGLEFGKLTGDFNPIHWLSPYAKASGFRDVIFQGFGTFARAVETLNTSVLAGDITRLHRLQVKFVRPLVLPADVGVFVHERDIFVGDMPGGPAYMTGRFEIGDPQ